MLLSILHPARMDLCCLSSAKYTGLHAVWQEIMVMGFCMRTDILIRGLLSFQQKRLTVKRGQPAVGHVNRSNGREVVYSCKYVNFDCRYDHIVIVTVYSIVPSPL